jgi:hypothetical protein
LEQIAEINDSMVGSSDWKNAMRVILFEKPAVGYELGTKLKKKIAIKQDGMVLFKLSPWPARSRSRIL